MVRSQISHDRQQLDTGMCYGATWQAAVLHGDAFKDEQSMAYPVHISDPESAIQSRENRHVPSFRISDISTHPHAEKRNFEVILELYADPKELLTIRLPFSII